MKQQQQSNLLSICLTYSCRHSNKHSYKMKNLWLMKSIRECIFFYHQGGKRKLSEKQLRLHFMQILLNLSVHISQAPCFITKRTKSNSNQLIHMKYNKKKKYEASVGEKSHLRCINLHWMWTPAKSVENSFLRTWEKSHLVLRGSFQVKGMH